MAMAKKYRDNVSKDDYDEEEDSLIELSSIERQRSPTSSRPLGGGLSNSPSSVCFGSLRSSIALILLLLVGVYYLGLQEGKHYEIHNTNDTNGDDDEKTKDQPTTSQTPAAENTSSNHAGSFTLAHLQATREEATKIVSLLDDYYFGKDQAKRMLMESWQGVWDFDALDNETETTTRDRAAKLVDTMARALVTDDQKTFLMGGIGSSVMAGHDNCHYDSYQTQMERLWQPVWKAAGMDFVFQNAGEGGGCGDSHQNQHYCVKQNISPNVDIVHYSWTYFEVGNGQNEHEDLIRWTQMLPKQPLVNILTIGDAPGSDHPYAQLTNHYSKYGYNAFYMYTGFRNGGHDYDSEKNDANNPFDRFGWGYVGDGYHNTTRYGELEEEVRQKSLGVVMRNWHPGPMGFQLISDAFTYVYTHALLKALDVIENDINDGHDPRDKFSASERKYLLKGDLPEPMYCDPEYCVVDEAPECLNYELPTFGRWGARVEEPDGELNPYAGEQQNWTMWHADNDLWYMVPKDDISFFQDRDDKEICRHLDACGGISAQVVDNGMVVFRLPKMEVGLVIICGFGHEYFTNNTFVEISYNTVPLDPSEMDVFPNGKCVRVLKRFPTSGRESETPTGHAYLAIKVLNDTEEVMRISHVITL